MADATRSPSLPTPTGIKLLCGLFVASAAVATYVGIQHFQTAAPVPTIRWLEVAFGLALAPLAYGLWTLQRWAWYWALGLLIGSSCYALGWVLLGNYTVFLYFLANLFVVPYVFYKKRYFTAGGVGVPPG